MLNKQEKAQAVADLKAKFEKAAGLVLTEYKGMTVEEMTSLRDDLRSKGIEYKVVKNTLARIASQGTSIEAAKDEFKGPIGIAVGYDDAAVVAKAVLDFSKDNEKLKVMSGVIDGNYYGEADIKAVAKLPSRDVLLGTIAGTMNAPATKMVRLLNATVVQFAYALSALKEKKAA